MLIKLEYPYNNDFIKGYLIIKNNGRSIVSLIDNQNNQTTTSYARYLMSINLKRYLLDTEEVDHINEDITNENINNLQILSKQENNLKRLINNKIGKKYIECICPNCDKIYSVEYTNCYLQPTKKSSMSFCTKNCMYSFRRNHKISDIDKKQIGVEQLIRIYFKYHDNSIEDIYNKIRPCSSVVRSN